MTENNIITPKERLMIVVQIYAGFGGGDDQLMTTNAAIALTDHLIQQSGCIVAGAVSLEHSMD